MEQMRFSKKIKKLFMIFTQKMFNTTNQTKRIRNDNLELKKENLQLILDWFKIEFDEELPGSTIFQRRRNFKK